MDVLARGGVPLESDPEAGIWGYPVLGYLLQDALLREQLQAGHSVVLECVASPRIRQRWKETAVTAGARFWIIETVCSDRELHRRRFDERGDASRGDWVLDWDVVEETLRTYVQHPDTEFVADAVNPVEVNVREITDRLHRT